MYLQCTCWVHRPLPPVLGNSDEEAGGEVGGSGAVEEGKRGMLAGKGVSCGVADLEVGSFFGLTGVVASDSEEDEDVEGEGGRGIMGLVFDEEGSSVEGKMGTSTYSTSGGEVRRGCCFGGAGFGLGGAG